MWETSVADESTGLRGGSRRSSGPRPAAIRARARATVQRREGGGGVSTLEVASGEIYGFLGPNGAGKTTIVRMLSAPTATSETQDLPR
jgi:ABC-type transport system involved in cytochrome bd biosynthesis fused ATPase/permease subunit